MLEIRNYNLRLIAASQYLISISYIDSLPDVPFMKCHSIKKCRNDNNVLYFKVRI